MAHIKFTLFCLLFISVNNISAQQLTPQSISNAGNSSSNGSILLESNIGGLVVAPVNTYSFIYTAGFLQPYAGITSNIPVINNINLNSAGIDNAGTSFSKNNAMIEFTVGEFASITLQNNSGFLTQGILQPTNILQGPLPVLGLEFNAKRISNNKVQLDWKTAQEIDNKGFYVERKKESEINFTQLHFVKSAAPNGNSSLPLNYSHIDTNSFGGKTYYRLKQEDFDGKFMYSTVRLVNGNNGKIISMKAWPIPSAGPVNISAEGIEKDVLLVFDNNGRLMKQQTITAQTPVQLTRLTPGTYIVKLGSQKELYQKIIVH